ncbi:hypothetical protein [Nocardioides bruguierae]|uniref:4Fe-4S Wbl-type domain-containing protein n=1 Tax=Nocardioides bruguierae TaxID=2945102 RepID=A0A9X2IGP6_9ACTN|nr:hypothetical protein [Nocardioides bruguierae]MCM0621789.1 hypothetical protein [Nocardioides bruguierae]
MRPISREVLARNEAAKLAAAELPDGACTRRGRLWSVLERAHRRASTPEEAAQVVAAAREEFCAGCPALMACHRLAEVGTYTGLAAGAAYENGERQKDTWTAPKAGRQRKTRPKAAAPTTERTTSRQVDRRAS